MRQLTFFDEENITGIDEDAPDVLQNAWKKAKQDMKKNFTELQNLSYEEKIERQTGIAWEFYMRNCVTDPKSGEKYGWGKVLDYIGIEWEDIPAQQIEMKLEDLQ